MGLQNEHVYDVTPPANAPVRIKQVEPRPNKRGDQAGLDIEAGRQHKFVAFNEHNPDPMKLPKDHYVTIMSGDEAFSLTAGQIQDMQKRHPNQQVFSRLAESVAEKGTRIDLKAFEENLNKGARDVREAPERRTPHHPPHIRLDSKGVHIQSSNGVSVDASYGTVAAAVAVGAAVAAHMPEETKAACKKAVSGALAGLGGTMVDLGKGGGCFGLAPASGKAEGHAANLNVRQ